MIINKKQLAVLSIAFIALAFNVARALTITGSKDEIKEVFTEQDFGATILYPSGGGTGTSTNPSFGQLLVGNSNGTYTLTATSSLGIAGTNYTAGGTLLDLTGTVFSVNEGTLTDTKFCTYEAGTGIECNSDGGGTTFSSIATINSNLSGETVASTTASNLNFVNDAGYFNSLSDLTLPQGNVYVGDASNNPTATSNLYIDTAGDVGIGTNAPRVALEIGDVDAVATFPALASPSSSSKSTIAVGGDATGRIYIQGSGQADFLFDHTGAGLNSKMFQFINKDGNLRFRSLNDNGTIRVDPILGMTSSGNVGVRTTTPDRKLDVLDATNPQLRLTHTDGSVYSDLQTTSSGHLYINPSGGNVGIGTSSPAYALDVYGDARIDGELYVYDYLSGATYTGLTELWDNTHSAGWYDGFTFNDNGDGSFDVSPGSGILKKTNSATGENTNFTITASTTLWAVDHDEVYVYVDYNGGSPTVATSSASVVDGRTNFNLGLVFREGTDLSFFEGGQVINDIPRRIQSRFNAKGMIELTSGGLVAETGERYLTVSDAVLWGGLTRFAVSAIDTSGADTFEYYYTDGAGGWQYLSDTASQINNTQYDNGGTLTNLTANRYRTDFVYLANDGDLIVILGSNNDVLSDAQVVDPPTSIPPHADFGAVIAKIIVQQGATNLEEVDNLQGSIFSSSGTVVHNETTDIQGGTTGEYYHLTLSNYTELNGWLDDVVLSSTGDISGIGTASTTNMFIDGWLKDGDGDIGSAGYGLTYDGTDLDWVDIWTEAENTSADYKSFNTLAELNAILPGETIASTTASNLNFVNDAGYLTSVAYTDLTGNPSDVITAGTNLSWATDTLNVDDAFLINSGSDTMAGTLTADGLTLGANELITLGAQTIKHDGSFFVFDDDLDINGTATSTFAGNIDATGSIEGGAIFDDGDQIFATFDKSVNIASSTIDDAYNSFDTATSTFELWSPSRAVSLTNLYCKTDTSTVLCRCGDGTNWTEAITCSATGQADDGSIANGTFTAREDFVCECGSTGGANSVYITATLK